MEPDRYEQNHSMYILGMISLLVSLGTLCFFVFMFPHLWFEYHYGVPEFITFWRESIIDNYFVDYKTASHMIAGFFLLISIISGLIAFIASSRIENAIYLNEDQPQMERPKEKMTFPFFWKVFGVVLLSYLGTIAFQWVISSSTA